MEDVAELMVAFAEGENAALLESHKQSLIKLEDLRDALVSDDVAPTGELLDKIVEKLNHIIELLEG